MISLLPDASGSCSGGVFRKYFVDRVILCAFCGLLCFMLVATIYVRCYVRPRSLLMISDPIVEEIRSFRAAHAAKYGNDLDRIFVAIKENEKLHIGKLVNREANRIPQKG